MPSRIRYWPVILPLLLLSLACSPALAQPAAPRVLTDEAEVSVLTIYPGPELHARFGHTAIRVADPPQDLDLVFNYGTFDFDSPLFIATFIRGRLDYYLSVASMEAALYQYQHLERRAVVEQVLELTAAEREATFAFLRHNAQPENRTYRYRFLDDNCSTRVRDVFETVLGETLRFEEVSLPANLTYRDKLAPYMADMPLLWLGMDLALGRPTDRSVTLRDAMFLPLPLMDLLERAQVTDESGEAGQTRQLVRETQTLYWFDGAEKAPAGFPWPTWLAWGLLAFGGVMTWRESRRPNVSAVQRRRGAVLADALLLGVVGLVGLVIAGLWGLTQHEVAGPNWNVGWAWPTHLVAAVALLRGPAGGPLLRGYLMLTAVGAAVAIVTSPWWPQPVPAAVVPVVGLLALRSAWLSWSMSGDAARGGKTVTTPTSKAHEPVAET